MQEPRPPNKTLGCSRCRFSTLGCSRCRQPSFRPRLGAQGESSSGKTRSHGDAGWPLAKGRDRKRARRATTVPGEAGSTGVPVAGYGLVERNQVAPVLRPELITAPAPMENAVSVAGIEPAAAPAMAAAATVATSAVRLANEPLPHQRWTGHSDGTSDPLSLRCLEVRSPSGEGRRRGLDTCTGSGPPVAGKLTTTSSVPDGERMDEDVGRQSLDTSTKKVCVERHTGLLSARDSVLALDFGFIL